MISSKMAHVNLSKHTATATSINTLQERVKQLENKVLDYKQRLDELRKAKHTTIVKREKEVLCVPLTGASLRGQSNDDTKTENLERQQKDAETKQEEEINKLRQQHLQEMAVQKEAKSKAHYVDDDELRLLRKTLEECNEDKSILMIENTELKEEIAYLENQLSVKEALWCKREDELKLKLSMEWGEKYAEWMAATEEKLNQLQALQQVQCMTTGDSNSGDQ